MNFGDNLKTYIANVKGLISRKHSRKVRRRFSGFAVALAAVLAAGFLWYSFYSHPDYIARQYYQLMHVLNLETEQSYGKLSLISDDDTNYFIDTHLDMPLRRIRVND